MTLTPNPLSAPEVEAHAWRALRGRAGVLGMLAYRTDERDGSVVFITIAPGSPPRLHTDMHGVRARIEDLEAGDL